MYWYNCTLQLKYEIWRGTLRQQDNEKLTVWIKQWQVKVNTPPVSASTGSLTKENKMSKSVARN